MRTMRTTLLILALAACLGLSGSAAAYKTFETITVGASSIGITASTIDPPGYPQMQKCVGRLETAEIRFRTDGGTPTASVGTVLEPLEILTIGGHEDADRLRMIRTTSTSGSITFECSAQ